MSEVEETIKRIQAQKGVVGVLVMDAEGRPIRSTLSQDTTSEYSGLLQQLAEKAKSVVREMDASNDLTFLRIRSKKHEIMIAPDKDYYLAVVQNPSEWTFFTHFRADLIIWIFPILHFICECAFFGFIFNIFVKE